MRPLEERQRLDPLADVAPMRVRPGHMRMQPADGALSIRDEGQMRCEEPPRAGGEEGAEIVVADDGGQRFGIGLCEGVGDIHGRNALAWLGGAV